MSSLARNRPLTLQSVACLWLGQQAVMAVAAVAVAAVAVVAVAVVLAVAVVVALMGVGMNVNGA